PSRRVDREPARPDRCLGTVPVLLVLHQLLNRRRAIRYPPLQRLPGGVIAPAPRIMRLFRAFSPSNPPESPSQEESSFASMLDTLESKSRSDGPPAGPRSIGLLPDSRSFLTVSAVA